MANFLPLCVFPTTSPHSHFLPSPSITTDSSWASRAPMDGSTPMSVII